jgi:hypothetical protein
LLGAVDGEIFDLVVETTSAVVAGAGITLGIFIGQNGSRRFQHGGRNVVLAGDQFQRRLLALTLFLDQFGDFRIGLGDGHGPDSTDGDGQYKKGWGFVALGCTLLHEPGSVRIRGGF